MQNVAVGTSIIDLLMTFCKFAVVGLLSNAVGFLFYCLVTWMGPPPLVAMTILYGAGALLGYVWNSRWTFRSDKSKRQLVGYVAAQLGGYGIDFVLLFVFAQRLGYPHQLVQASAVVIVAAYLFLVLRYVVFASAKSV